MLIKNYIGENRYIRDDKYIEKINFIKIYILVVNLNRTMLRLMMENALTPFGISICISELNEKYPDSRQERCPTRGAP